MRRRTLGLVAGSVSILGLWLVWPNADPAPRRMAPVPPSAVAPPDAPATESFLAVAEAPGIMTEIEDASVKRALAPMGPPPDDAREAWKPFSASIEALEAVVQRPGLTLPEVDFGDLAPPILQVQLVTQALLVRGWDKAVSGYPEQGVDDMLNAYAFAVRIVDAGNYAIDVAVGVGLQGAALRELGELLDASVDDAAHRAALAGLLEHRARGGAAARVVPRDCAAVKLQTAEDLGRPRAMLRYTQLEGVVDDLGIPPGLANSVVSAAVYDPAETRAQIDAACFAAMARLTLGQAPVASDLAPPVVPPVGPELVLELFNNPAGHAAAVGTDYSYLSIGATEAAVAAGREVLTTVVAARLFLWAGGKPPARVEDLVPVWLPTAPIDPYSPDGIRIVDGVVRSAGEDAPDRPRYRPRLAIAIE